MGEALVGTKGDVCGRDGIGAMWVLVGLGGTRVRRPRGGGAGARVMDGRGSGTDPTR